MFGKRPSIATMRPPIPAGVLPPSFADPPTRTKPDDIARMGFAAGRSFARSEKYFEIKRDTFTALIDGIDLAELAKLNADDARRELRQLAGEIVNLGPGVLPHAEREELLEDICNDVLGLGPLEPLLAQDGITDIMINGAGECYVEVDGQLIAAPVQFADNSQLASICQRIASRVGRRVDDSTPICDARLPDGSRVNIIFPPLAIDGPALTIRKFRRERLTLGNS